MNLQVIIVFIILATAVFLYVTEILAIDLVAILVLLALAFTRILSPTEALSGFSDQAVITIAGFFVMSAALFNTGIVEAIGHRLSRIGGTSKTRFLLVMMFVAAVIASFMSNVVTTAVLMPAVIGIARRMKQPASQFLMPLAFAAVLGGKCTLVGSTTNLAVNGILPKYNLAPFTLFEFLPLGIPLLIAGIVYMLTIGVRLLPNNPDTPVDEHTRPREFVTEVVVRPDSRLIGRTLENADFKGIYDLQILGVVRAGAQLLPHKEAVFQAKDVLLVKGKLDQILSIKDANGLEIKDDKGDLSKNSATKDKDDESVIVEAILSPSSVFAGRTLKQIRFGSRYGADVLAVYRHSEALHEKISDISLNFGDVLVIQGKLRRINSLRQDPNFLTLDDVEHTPLRKNRALWAISIFLIAAVVAATNRVPLSQIALAAAAAMILTRCITIQEAYDKIEWSAIILIAASIPLGIAMEKTGAAKVLADQVTHYLGFGGPMVLLGSFFLFTAILTQPMANAACALIIAPIAINVANQLQVNPRAFAITIAIAASCTFPTPLEAVTAIIYGPGKYRFTDYVRVGGLLTIVIMIVTLLVVPIFWPLR